MKIKPVKTQNQTKKIKTKQKTSKQSNMRTKVYKKYGSAHFALAIYLLLDMESTLKTGYYTQ